MPSIVDRYLIKEVALTFIATLIVLLAMVLSHRLAQYLGQAAGGLLAQNAITVLLGLQAVRHLVDLIPLALLLAIMLALGRLYRDHEIVALSACGLGPGAVYRPLILLLVPLVLLVTELSLNIAPKALQLQYEVRNRARQEAELTLFQAGAFKAISGGQTIVYVGSLGDDQRTVQEIFIFSLQRALPTLITGISGYQTIDPQTADRYLNIDSGHYYEGLPGEAVFRDMEFSSARALLISPAPDAGSLRRKAMPTRELFNNPEPRIQSELQRRISAPVTLILITLLAPLLAHARPREGRYSRIVVAILIYTIYINLLGVAQAWLEKDLVAKTLGLWWVHALGFALVAILWWYHYGRARLTLLRRPAPSVEQRVARPEP